MTTNLYLAMTAAEIRSAVSLPSRPAWMACHFSPYSTGLSNLPEALPEGSLLMLNDVTPIRGHDPHTVREQLFHTLECHRCDALVLDFQRHPSPETQVLAQYLTQAPPCPVAVSAPFAEELSCPVLLPPCPAYSSLEEHTAAWKGRDIWLEISRETEVIEITASGAEISLQRLPLSEGTDFSEEALHCHYQIETAPERIRFTLWRTDEDILGLCRQGQNLGIQRFLGLYQELGNLPEENENRSA